MSSTFFLLSKHNRLSKFFAMDRSSSLKEPLYPHDQEAVTEGSDDGIDLVSLRRSQSFHRRFWRHAAVHVLLFVFYSMVIIAIWPKGSMDKFPLGYKHSYCKCFQ